MLPFPDFSDRPDYELRPEDNEGPGRDDSKDEYRFEAVRGLFSQSEGFVEGGAWEHLRQISFGLLDTNPERWTSLKVKVDGLRKSAPEGVSYKVLFVERHGESFHNVSAAKYGRDIELSCDTDGEITWAPDSKLTPKGEDQARDLRDAWTRVIEEGCPTPEICLSSPLSRAIKTCCLTREAFPGTRGPIVVEGWRETFGVYLCDMRSSKAQIARRFPQVTFEDSFTETDELWNATAREREVDRRKRVRRALNWVFDHLEETYISITTHNRFCTTLVEVIGHARLDVENSEVLPIVLKATKNKQLVDV